MSNIKTRIARALASGNCKVRVLILDQVEKGKGYQYKYETLDISNMQELETYLADKNNLSAIGVSKAYTVEVPKDQ